MNAPCVIRKACGHTESPADRLHARTVHYGRRSGVLGCTLQKGHLFITSFSAGEERVLISSMLARPLK
jgi:hypothetical protein